MQPNISSESSQKISSFPTNSFKSLSVPHPNTLTGSANKENKNSKETLTEKPGLYKPATGPRKHKMNMVRIPLNFMAIK